MNGYCSGFVNGGIALVAAIWFDDWRVAVPVLVSGFAGYAGGLWHGMFGGNRKYKR